MTTAGTPPDFITWHILPLGDEDTVKLTDRVITSHRNKGATHFRITHTGAAKHPRLCVEGWRKPPKTEAPFDETAKRR